MPEGNGQRLTTRALLILELNDKDQVDNSEYSFELSDEDNQEDGKQPDKGEGRDFDVGEHAERGPINPQPVLEHQCLRRCAVSVGARSRETSNMRVTR